MGEEGEVGGVRIGSVVCLEALGMKLGGRFVVLDSLHLYIYMYIYANSSILNWPPTGRLRDDI